MLLKCFTGANQRSELWCLRDHANRHVHQPGAVPEPWEQSPAGKHQTSGARNPSVAQPASPANARASSQRGVKENNIHREELEVTWWDDASWFAAVTYHTVLDTDFWPSKKKEMLCLENFIMIFLFFCLALMKKKSKWQNSFWRHSHFVRFHTVWAEMVWCNVSSCSCMHIFLCIFLDSKLINIGL